MREIKFRAWDDMLLKMFTPLTLHEIMDKDFNNCNKYQLKIMQFTGLKDSNGVDIYEGDVFWHMVEEGLIGVIEWCYDELQWVVRIVPNIKQYGFVPDLDNAIEWWKLCEYDEIEVISNIYEVQND